MTEFAIQELKFTDGLSDVLIMFRPEESDWWHSFTVNRKVYDVHYLEDEDMQIEVYRKGNYSLPIYTQKIKTMSAEKHPFNVVETNPEENTVSLSLGISEQRDKEIRKRIIDLSVKGGNICQVMAQLSAEVKNANEFALAMFLLGDFMSDVKTVPNKQ